MIDELRNTICIMQAELVKMQFLSGTRNLLDIYFGNQQAKNKAALAKNRQVKIK